MNKKLVIKYECTHHKGKPIDEVDNKNIINIQNLVFEIEKQIGYRRIQGEVSGEFTCMKFRIIWSSGYEINQL